MLPKIDVPIYELTIPSNKKVIKVRPFSVKEEKLLMIALESKEPDEIINTMKQVVNNCILDGDADINKLPFFDVDYMFIFLRAKSVGDHVEVSLTCNNETENGICGNVFSAEMDISKVEIISDESVSNDIKLDKDKGVKMKYPNYAVMKRIEFSNEVDQKTNTIINAIDHIYDKKGIYSSKDYSKDELKEFVEGLTEENYRKLEEFVDNMPTFAVVLEKECNKCGFHHRVRYTDFYDFFF
jgi:hypothetical protein